MAAIVMKMVQISPTMMINPEHITQINAHPYPTDTAYTIYTITFYYGGQHIIRLRDWNQDYPFNSLASAYPALIGALNGENIRQ
jgi:hypothetical protein